MSPRSMPEDTVIELLSKFEAVGTRVWIDGGWAVDALLDRQTRPHEDLDIVVQKQDVEQARDVLKGIGYKDKMDADTRPWNFVMADDADHEVDLHVIDFDEDVHDVLALHRRFGVPLPDEYISLGRQASDDAHAATQLVKYTLPSSLPTEVKEILWGALYHPSSEKIEAMISSVYAQSYTRLFGLMMREKVVAVMGIRLDSQSVAEILHIAVGEGSRGKGYGRQLIELVVQEAALRSLYAETDRDAVGFYQRCGFAIESLGEKYPGVERFLCRWSSN